METIIIAIITFVLGYITGVYLPLKFRKEDKTPKISISPLQKRQNYFDITNHGGDILNLKIEIFSLQDGIKQKIEMDKFFNADEDSISKLAHYCNSLKKGETKKVMGCPLYSDNGKIEVFITGKDINNQAYKEKLILKNNLRK